MANRWYLTLTLVLFAYTQAHNNHRRRFDDNFAFRQPQHYRLCSYTQQAYDKCLYTLQAAANESLTLPLECTQADSLDACLSAVRSRASNMVVLTGHGYKPAREQGLAPVLYARESDDSLYIAVAPRTISLVQLQEASLAFDESSFRALHAAIFFNLQRGFAICSMTSNVTNAITIKIVNAAEYTPTADEILICPDRTYAEYEDFRMCNVEAQLQRAVFVPRHDARKRFVARDVQEIFNTILQHFGAQAEAEQQFNFFSTFNGSNDVIFKNDTIAFDLKPLIRNGVDEQLFNYLHCNTMNQDHDHIIKAQYANK